MIGKGSTFIRKIVRFVTKPFLKIRYESLDKKALREAEKIIDFSTIDIIHSNSYRNDIGALLAKKYGIPHIWHLREKCDESISLKRDYIQFMNNYSEYFIAVSHVLANDWIKKGLAEKKITIIYNGVNDSIGNRKNRNDNIVRGIITGFISPFKGQYDLIKSLTLIKDDLHNKFKLDIYGQAACEYLIRMKIYVLLHGLSKIVSFKGYVNNLDQLYPYYDLGFTCSKAEGFGRVTAEYMMNGLCVIASDTGANTEIIRDGDNGYLYRYKDNNNLANKIKYVIENYGEASSCAKRGIEDALNNYTKEANADNIYHLYCEILNS